MGGRGGQSHGAGASRAGQFNIVQVLDEQLHGFPDGTVGGILKREAAVGYLLDIGITIWIPKNMDLSMQPTTVHDVIEALKLLPKEVQKAAPTVIHLLDYENPRDSYWRQVYPGFTKSAATGGQKGISIYGLGSHYTIQGLQGTLAHEIGHAIDQRLIDSAGAWFSQGHTWASAMSMDASLTGKKSVTTYGRSSVKEDFAESIMLYVRQGGDAFAKRFPNRASIISKLLQRYK